MFHRRKNVHENKNGKIRLLGQEKNWTALRKFRFHQLYSVTFFERETKPETTFPSLFGKTYIYRITCFEFKYFITWNHFFLLCHFWAKFKRHYTPQNKKTVIALKVKNPDLVKFWFWDFRIIGWLRLETWSSWLYLGAFFAVFYFLVL